MYKNFNFLKEEKVENSVFTIFLFIDQNLLRQSLECKIITRKCWLFGGNFIEFSEFTRQNMTWKIIKICSPIPTFFIPLWSLWCSQPLMSHILKSLFSACFDILTFTFHRNFKMKKVWDKIAKKQDFATWRTNGLTCKWD